MKKQTLEQAVKYIAIHSIVAHRGKLIAPLRRYHIQLLGTEVEVITTKAEVTCIEVNITLNDVELGKTIYPPVYADNGMINLSYIYSDIKRHLQELLVTNNVLSTDHRINFRHIECTLASLKIDEAGLLIESLEDIM